MNAIHFRHTLSVVAALLRFEYSADSVVSYYFREHGELGHKDRGVVAEAAFAVLRRRRYLETLASLGGEAPAPRRLLLAFLGCVRGLNRKEMESYTKPDELEWIVAARQVDVAALPAAVRHDLPDWLDERLTARFGAEQIDALAVALNRPAPLDLRVNPMKATRDEVLQQLAADELPAAATALSPLGIRLKNKPALNRNALFTSGAIEVQDEGSQLLGFLLQPKRGEMVADFCAGAGGKTLLLGALMRSTGRLYAFDVSEKRLGNFKPRLARSGLSNVHPVRIEHERDIKIKRLAGKMDRVLVDAPCSGLGTLRRNPDLKWRQSEQSIAELTVKQASILASAATLVKPGGRLVYATCSLLAEENDLIADAFLAAHPEFVEADAGTILGAQGIAYSGRRLTLLPHLHGTDGFFAAAFERSK
jgi:16S rRNA (cytosine967-C5)-methyltransferase